ncbi:MAG: hypothetical protein ACLFQK_09795, partial [Fibrobacterota bacterium]
EGKELEILDSLNSYADSKLKPYLLDFVIHGSLSDGNFTPYSDIDTWAVIRKEVFTNPSFLKDLKHHFWKINKIVKGYDPIQHHGVFISTETDLLRYYEARFPLILLDHSTSFMNAPTLSFKKAPDFNERSSALVKTVHRILNIKTPPQSAYNIKMFTSWIMLLPSLYRQVFYDYSYKPDAIRDSKNEFPEKAWSSVEYAGELRKKWHPEKAEEYFLRDAENFLSCSHIFASEILNKFNSEFEKSDNIFGIKKTIKSSRIPAADHPVNYSKEEFLSIISESAEEFCALPGVHSVYTIGNADSPVPGISDLDLLIISEDNPGSPDYRQTCMNVIKKHIAPSNKKSDLLKQYIEFHEPLVLKRKDALTLGKYFFPLPKFRKGTADIFLNYNNSNTPDNTALLLLMISEGYFQLIKILNLLNTRPFPVREASLRANSAVYEIALSEKITGRKPSAHHKEFSDQIKSLRKNWFQEPENERIPLLHSLLKKSAQIILESFKNTADYLEKNDIKITGQKSDLEAVSENSANFRLYFKPSNDINEFKISYPCVPLSFFPIIKEIRPSADFKFNGETAPVTEKISEMLSVIRNKNETYLSIINEINAIKGGSHAG